MLIELFNQGGPFMWPILILFVFGLMICLERVYTLAKASLATSRFIPKLNKALKEDGVDAAMNVCKETPGPIPEIFHAGLSRVEQGIEVVEKSIENAGSVEMAFLEKGMIWLATVITVAPMLGFAGTVSGMVKAFQDIAAANNISPAVVASGISEALLTTLFGLIVGITIQILYNLFTARVDGIIVDMEESSINLIDTIASEEYKKK
ncbi:MAG: MotA/TolQ/ExbB proton channel family protein [Candidatus Marinimicrobia bacterium]|nr:MotA/TolQ/ExbB proton channel family protein [Candidatus Neomarinimicrobiota bacterium]MBL7066430.1 MotA/TolQ/ExbB proton channel family protein [Candidatus Neomarinimicrobiota bacterium]